jgi:hypothetical protein
MTLEDIETTLADIREKADEYDDEAAHGLEKYLYKTVLRAIASNVPNAAKLAKLALTAEDIEFERWFA